MQKFIFLRIGLVLNLLEDAVGRLARARARARTAGLQDVKLFFGATRATKLHFFLFENL